MSIPEVIQKLDEKSIISKNGMGGTEVVVDKELLRQASTYLKDYLYLMGSEVEDAKDSD